MSEQHISKEEYRRIYEALDKVSPVVFDCGRFCGAACCDVETYSDMGMYLLPGEEAVHDRSDNCFEWDVDDAEDLDFPPSWKGEVYFIRCRGSRFCDRKKRPIQCRTYPVAPHLTEDGKLVLVYSDMEVPYVCPMIASEAEFSTAFLKETHSAWKILIRDRRIYDLVESASRYRGDGVTFLYGE